MADMSRDEILALAAALEDAEETLGFSRTTPFPDPSYHEVVKELGRRIGFGALMSTAEAAWKEVLAEQGTPEGTEFVCGPCRSQYDNILRTVAHAREFFRLVTPPARSYADGVEDAASKLETMFFMLSIGSPDDGPFTRQDRVREEVVEQGAAAIRALAPKEG